MINISRLYCGVASESDRLRYGSEKQRSPTDIRPVVVWNATQRCNLHCLHCYSDSENKKYPGELSTAEAMGFFKDLAQFQVPAVLLSGGEPLMRPDLFELVPYGKELGLRFTLSTNGTLIDERMGRRVHQAGFSYVGISLDGIGATNDFFRGQGGAFRRALEAVRHLKKVDQRVGLRMTLTRHNISDLPQIFELIEREQIDRACFYHLVPTGRGREIADEMPSPEETKGAIDLICRQTRTWWIRGIQKEVLTVDNHVDGVYVYLKLLEEGSPRALTVRELLAINGGALKSSGVGIAAVDPHGNVHPDQFWRHDTLGNIRETSFSQIWKNEKEPLLSALRRRRDYLKGSCSSCPYLDLCGGSNRIRAQVLTGDLWAPDPACYLGEQELSTPR